MEHDAQVVLILQLGPRQHDGGKCQQSGALAFKTSRVTLARVLINNQYLMNPSCPPQRAYLRSITRAVYGSAV